MDAKMKGLCVAGSVDDVDGAIDPHCAVFVPAGAAVDPVTHTRW